MNTTVTPTRMELTRLKKKLLTARRGHKLLKDKRDEMMRQFLKLIEENKNLRLRVEDSIKRYHDDFTLAQAEMGSDQLKTAILSPKQDVFLDVKYKSIMSVKVPQFTYSMKTNKKADIFPYSFATTSAALDEALENLFEIFKDMVKLAECEKACQKLSYEIEKTNRRVNALEYIVIPEAQTNIKCISAKIDENERSNSVRLMKIKDMMLNASS